MEDEWQKMVEEALNETRSPKKLNIKESSAEESGEYISSVESDDDTISTSSCDSQDWAPTRPRLPINIPMDLPDNQEAEPDDAEEAVRSAGLGMQQLSIEEKQSHLPSKSSATMVNESEQKPPMMLPAFFEKLQKFSSRFDSTTLYSLITSISLVPFKESLDSTIDFSNSPTSFLPNSLANMINIPEVSDSLDSSSIPFISMLTILSSTLGSRFRQSWIIPFSIKENSKKCVIFQNPIHDESIDRVFAHYKLAYLGAHSSYFNQELNLNGNFITLTNQIPALLSFKGSAALTSALASLYKDGTSCYNIELFGMSLRETTNCPKAESEYHKGKNIFAHIIKRLLELTPANYLLVHRSDEALCYACSEIGLEKDIDLVKEMPSSISMNELNHDI